MGIKYINVMGFLYLNVAVQVVGDLDDLLDLDVRCLQYPYIKICVIFVF